MKKKVYHIYLFRHGLTSYNRDRRFTGYVDVSLVPSGFDDAKIVALRLKNKKIQVAFHTKLKRSKQTLKEVLKYHPECKKIIQDDRMIERDYGDLNSKTHLEIVEKYGSEKYDKWRRSFNTKPPGGESLKEVEKRVRKFVEYIKNFVKKEKVNVAISAHGNSIRLFR